LTDRLSIIVQVCRDNNITPLNNTFPGLVRKIVCGKLGYSLKEAKEDTMVLSIAYRTDKWHSYPPITKTDKIESAPAATPKINQPETSQKYIREVFEKLKNKQSEPINHQPKLTPTETDYITNDVLIQTLHRTAREDTNPDGIGRILLADARQIADNKYLTCQNIMELWKRKYPTIDIEQRTNNILLIYWDGKETVQNTRKAQRAAFVPELNEFSNLESDGEQEKYVDPEEIKANKPDEQNIIW
jgi:hypothetical protein